MRWPPPGAADGTIPGTESYRASEYTDSRLFPFCGVTFRTVTEQREAIEVPDGIDRLRSLIAQDHIDQGADLLAELRDAWRTRPNDFSPEDVASLQELATDIVDARMAAVDKIGRASCRERV